MTQLQPTVRPLAALVAPLAAAIQAERGVDPLAPVTLLVPDRAVGRWLVRALAERLGVAANLHVQTLPAWLATLRPEGPHAEAPLDAERLSVSLLGHLLDPRLGLDTPALAPVARWLSRAGAGPDPEAAAELAARLASRFLSYAECVPSPLDPTEAAGAGPEPTALSWQRALWARTFTADGRLRTDPPNHLAALLQPPDPGATPTHQLRLLGPTPRWRLPVPLLLDPRTAVPLPKAVLDVAPGVRSGGLEAVCAALAGGTRWLRFELSEIKAISPKPLPAAGLVAERALGVEAVCAALRTGELAPHQVAVYLADGRRAGELEALAAAFEARGFATRWPGRRAATHDPAVARARALVDAAARGTSPNLAEPGPPAVALAALQAPRPWATWCADLDALWHRWLPEGEDHRTARERLRGMLSGLALAAAEAPVAVPGGLSEDLGPVVPAAAFFDRVRARLDALGLPRAPAEIGAVGALEGIHLGLLGASAAVPAEAVWVLGLSPEAFVSRATVDGLDLRAEADRARTEPGPASLRLALNAACDAAGQHLWLSWPAVDEAGEPVAPAEALAARLETTPDGPPLRTPPAPGREAAAATVRAELTEWLGAPPPAGARLWRELDAATRAAIVPATAATPAPATTEVSLRALRAYLQSPVQGAARWRLAEATVGDLDRALEGRFDDAAARSGRPLDPPLVDLLRGAFWRGDAPETLLLLEASPWDRVRAQAGRALLAGWTAALAQLNAPPPAQWLDLALADPEDALGPQQIALSALHLPHGQRVSLRGRLARLSPQRVAAVVCTDDAEASEAHLIPALLSLATLCAAGEVPNRFTAIVLTAPTAEGPAPAVIRALPVPDADTARAWLADLAHDLATERGDARLPIEVVTRWYHERFGEGRSYARPFERRIERNADRRGPVRDAMDLPLADAERMNALDRRRFRPLFAHLIGGGS